MWATIVAVLMAIMALADAQGQVTYTSLPGKNIDGDIIILHSGSLAYVGNHGGPFSDGIKFHSIDECRDSCKVVAGCNAYVFCNKKGGCGKGCIAWNKKYPPAKLKPNSQYELDASTKVPLLGLGPYAGCAGDKFPQGTCSLKKVADPAKPKLSSDTDGWTSGTISVPAACAGTPARSCEGCLKSKDFTKCAACLKARPDERLSQAVFGPQSDVGCVNCYTYTSGPSLAQCEKCVNNAKAPCNRCTQDVKSVNLGACLTCTTSLSAASVNECVYCATEVTDAGKLASCLSCAKAVAPTYCPDNRSVFIDQYKRYNCTSRETGVCKDCAKSAFPDECTKCVTAMPGSSDCTNCGNFVPKDKQTACFKCASTNYSVDTPCSDCYRQTDVNTCLGCYTSKVSHPTAKKQCFYCTQKSDLKKVSACWNCLKDFKTAYEYPGKCFA